MTHECHFIFFYQVFYLILHYRENVAMKVRAYLLVFFFMFFAANTEAENNLTYSSQSDTTVVGLKETKAHKSFGRILVSPFKWIVKNWSDYDPHYAIPSFYNWSAQLLNTTSSEWMSMDNGIAKVDMRSKLSNKIGAYFGWRWLVYGFSVDVTSSKALEGKRRKTEFDMSINSNLVNIDLFHRRTGGDFSLTALDMRGYSQYDKDLANKFNVGDEIRYKVDGININFFLNHRKYSNPASATGGAVQLRSAGSPIVGIGFTRQVLKSNLSNFFVDYASMNMGYVINSPDDFLTLVLADIDNIGMYINGIPSNIRINDLHLQLGYAQNIVFSPRLMLGLSLIGSPGFKWMSLDNYDSYLWSFAPQIVDFFNGFEDESENITIEDVQYRQKSRHVGFDVFARASLRYSLNQWRIGLAINGSNFLYNHDDLKFNSHYGNATLSVTYNFGRKKDYRHGGRYRDTYISSALTKHQIEQMRDTMPQGNVADPIISVEKQVHYKKDVFNLNLFGCDLVMGPNGDYGSFEITDGYMATGQDPKGLLRVGTKLSVDKDGNILIMAGHKKSIRAGNWWKSKLDMRQNPLNWYPEMLHYALKGRLTCYVRSHSFGSMQPMKLVIDDFYLAHGYESKEFFLIGANSFASHSAYSITGEVPINGRLCRVYIESKNRGKKMNVYVNRMRASSRKWMMYVPDNRAISRISIPGTHDAGSASLPENSITSMGHTQNFTVTEQLYDGIRAFDIRLKKNMKYGHTLACRDGFDESLVDIEQFFKDNPSEFIVALVGSDEGGKWDAEMQTAYKALIDKYSHLFIEDFSPSTPIGDVRGKILVIKRQEACPFGKLLKFEDNSVFNYDCFVVQDVYKEHKTTKKIKLVEDNLRKAFENENPNKWFISFNSIAWDPRHHRPYYSSWGAWNIRKPMNIRLRELIEDKEYSNFGMLFLDFYNDHGDKPQLVESIINSNFLSGSDDDFIPAEAVEEE